MSIDNILSNEVLLALINDYNKDNNISYNDYNKAIEVVCNTADENYSDDEIFMCYKVALNIIIMRTDKEYKETNHNLDNKDKAINCDDVKIVSRDEHKDTHDKLNNKDSRESKNKDNKYSIAVNSIILTLLSVFFILYLYKAITTFLKVDNEITDNDVFGELELSESDNGIGKSIESLSMNGLYGEAYDLYGNGYSVCHSYDNEFFASDWNRFTYVIDKNYNGYAVGADENGNMTEVNMTMLDILDLTKNVINSDYSSILLSKNNGMLNTAYYTMTSKAFNSVLKSYGKEIGTDLDLNDFADFCGLEKESIDKYFCLVFAVTMNDDVTLIDVVYVNDKGSQPIYEAVYRGSFEWKLGEDWYNTEDKLDLTSDKSKELFDKVNSYYESIINTSEGVE